MKERKLFKLAWTYSDYRDEEVKRYFTHAADITNENVIEFNDTLTDEILGKDAFPNEIADMFNTLPICIVNKMLNVYDDEFFEITKKLIDKYKAGVYDPYIEDEDRPLLDKDIETVLNYMEEQKAKN